LIVREDARMPCRPIAVALVVAPCPALAWNYAGHRAIDSIAFRELLPETHARVAAVLKSHPAYADSKLAVAGQSRGFAINFIRRGTRAIGASCYF
jgi:hypothetical protein